MGTIVATYKIRISEKSLDAYLGIGENRVSVTFADPYNEDKTVYFSFGDDMNSVHDREEIFRRIHVNEELQSIAVKNALFILLLGPNKSLYSIDNYR